MISISLVPLFAAVLGHAQIVNLGPQASEVAGFQATRYSECDAFIQTCQPPAASCASVICQQCTDLGQTQLNACCATESAPGSCLATALRRNPNAAPATTTAPAATNSMSPSSASATVTTGSNTAAASPAPTGIAACEGFASTLSQCNSQTPGFTSSVFSAQAPCLCYDSNQMFDPSNYDGVWNNCLSYYKTSSVEFFSSLNANGPLETAPCSKLGDITGGGGSSGSNTRGPTSGATSRQTSVVPTSTSSAAALPHIAGKFDGLGNAGFGGAVMALLGFMV